MDHPDFRRPLPLWWPVPNFAEGLSLWSGAMVVDLLSLVVSLPIRLLGSFPGRALLSAVLALGFAVALYWSPVRLWGRPAWVYQCWAWVAVPIWTLAGLVLGMPVALCQRWPSGKSRIGKGGL